MAIVNRVTLTDDGAQVVTTDVECDYCYDATDADETVNFGLDGAAYELDLCTEHAAAVRDTMCSMVGAARRAHGRLPVRHLEDVRTPVGTSSLRRPVCQHCGEWMTVPDREQGGGRTKRYCSGRCRTAASRAAKASAWPVDTLHAALGVERA
jgi:hypothetical protein